MTTLLVGAALLPATWLVGPAANAAPVGQGFNLNPSDLAFILQQIKIAEEHTRTRTPSNPCATLMGDGPLQIPDDPQGEELPWGLRTVDGTCNNLVPGQEEFGAADNPFPRHVPRQLRNAETGDPDGPGPAASGPSSYTQKTSTVIDSQPRVISNLIVDQTGSNPAAVEAAGPGAAADGSGTLFIPNTAPDVGLSAPFNSWFTLFGQFFDHGLDLVSKGGSGTVFMPLQPDDPLWAITPPAQRFMVLTRATNQPGPNGTLGNSDDVQEATNSTATFVDQSQTYTSHPSTQVFVREYAVNANGDPVSTGIMFEGPDGGMATWASVKQQAATKLGIQLTDNDVHSVPLLATDPYGKFIPGPNGYPQMATSSGLVEGDPAADGGNGKLVPANATKSAQAFLVDIAHHAVPGTVDHDHNPGTPAVALTKDTDPGTTDDRNATTYDDEMLDAHFIAGDGRVNENIGLTAVHQIFHSEHNRLAGEPTVEGSIKDVLTSEDPASVSDWQLSPGVWNGERIFQAAKFVTEMQYQHLAFEEFARKVQPMVNLFGEGGGGYDTSVNPAIRAEFAHAVYRFGHSMLTETVARKNANGTNNDIPLLGAFMNPPSYTDGGTLTPEQAAGSIVRGMTRQVGNEIDEFVTEALRNNLLGLPLDLASLNMARARDTGTPSLNAARRQFYAESNNSALVPYTSWTDFGFNLKHRDSLVNFVAAYGTHPSITGDMETRRAAAARIIANDPNDLLTPADSADFMNSAGIHANSGNGVTTTGVDDIDLWTGGLAEKQMVFGGLLGPTFNYVFELQMEDLQFGDRFYYLARTAGLNLLTQLEGNSFAELIQRNTDVSGLPADVFSRPDYVFNVGTLMTGPTIADDIETVDYDEGNRLTEPGMHLSRVPAGTLRYTGPAHTVFNGTSGDDRVWASEGDDTIRGNDGNDWMQGGDGADSLIGGLGNDILNDLFGDDVLKGGDGNDALSSGQGFGGDLNQGGRGKDFIVNGNDLTETFAGPGDDFVLGGDDMDTVFGDDGDDWLEGGAGPFNLLQGDNGAPFQDDPNEPGHDVLDGDGGEQDFDSEGGDDIGLAGPGIQRMEGMLGFDWFAHKGDPQAGNTDMNFTGVLPPSVDALRDRFDLTEALSGWNRNDVLRGDDRVAADIIAPGDAAIGDGHQLTGPGIDRIQGLQGVVGSGVRSYSGGNIILGGGGDDILEGRGGDDIIDGDKWLNVRLSVRTNPADPSTETRTADSMTELQADVFSGELDPGNIVIVREIIPGSAGADVDTAMYSDVRSNYQCSLNGGALGTCPTTLSGESLRIVHDGGTGLDGTDTLRNVERLLFSDSAAPGAPTILNVIAGNQSATVNFDPAAGSVVNGFTVRVLDAGSGAVLREVTASGDATSLVVTGLTNGRAIRFAVSATNAFGSSPFSAVSNIVTPNPTVPAAPGVPTATASNGQATVNWNAPNNGGAAINGYLVQPVNAAGNAVGAPRAANGTSLVVTGLTNGTTYRFSVQARNSVGTGPSSGLSNAVTPTAAPSAPAIGNATAGVGQATVNWTAPASTGGSALTGYLVRVFTTAGVLVTERSAPSNATSLNVTGLTNGTSYRFQVRADNAVGSSPFSGLSNAVTPATLPGVPSIVGASAGDGRATVNWTAPATNGSPITNYLVRVQTSAGVVLETRTVAPTARSLTAIGLVNGRAYRFRVAARSLAGTSAFSGLSNLVTPSTLPGAPGIGAAAPRNASALVRWTAPGNGGSVITSYRVQVLNATGAQVGSIRVASSAARSLLVTGLANGNRYRFRVQAVNANGRGAFSAQSNQVIPARPPAAAAIAPASSGAFGGRATAVARWKAPRSNGGARVTGFVVTVRQVSSAGRVVSRTKSPVMSRTARSKVFRLPRGTYQFRVVARNKIGTSRVSRWSNRVVAR